MAPNPHGTDHTYHCGLLALAHEACHCHKLRFHDELALRGSLVDELHELLWKGPVNSEGFDAMRGLVPFRFRRFGAMDSFVPYDFMMFGAMDDHSALLTHTFWDHGLQLSI